jgi:hypothetical protein
MAMKSGAQYKAGLDSAHAKAIAQQRANTPVPGMSAAADHSLDRKSGIKQGSAKDNTLDKRRAIKDPKMTPVSKGHKPNGAHGRAAVRALGRTKTTGNFKKIEKAKGKGAAIAAYQNALAAHKAGK